ncbi:hypothetical protein ABZY00_08840 [Streptomyces griseoflavus]|uniref:hypothetical protein n=1 Tax=Streptomyces griseoflavus TaxID=35619 RepID=UPI0033B3762D
MRALPARRIALGALCAALLAGITGPAAVAADSLPGPERAVTSAALLARIDKADADRGELAPVAALARAVLESEDGQLPPGRARVLGEAAKAAVVAAADDDPSTSVSVTTVTTTTATSSTAPATTPALAPAVAVPSTGVLLPQSETTGFDFVDDTLDAVWEALDGLLDLLLPEGDALTTDQVVAETDEEDSTTAEEDAATAAEDAATAAEEDATAVTEQELAAVDDLLDRVDELVDALTGGDPEVSILPAPAEAAPSASTSPALFPALTSLLLPSS